MKTANIGCKLSVFADYQAISYTNENLLKILDEFKDESFIPNKFNEINLFGNIINRIQLLSTINPVVITINTKRIDLEISSKNKEGFSKLEQDDNVSYLLELYSRIKNVFDELMPKGNRLAWFPTYAIYEMNGEEKEIYKDRFIKSNQYYKNILTDEFAVQYAGKIKYAIDDDINVITNISKLYATYGEEGNIDGYNVSFDINTSANKLENRFNNEDVKAFILDARKTQIELEKYFL